MRTWLLILAAACLLTGCAAPKPQKEADLRQSDNTAPVKEDQEMKQTLQLSIQGTPVEVTWEANQAVEELIAAAREEPIMVQTSAYGGFEQVGPLPRRFPSEDTYLTTVPGDIMLFSGDQIVLFYGSNSWSYTRLGHMALAEDELAQLLAGDSVTLELSVK